MNSAVFGWLPFLGKRGMFKVKLVEKFGAKPKRGGAKSYRGHFIMAAPISP